MKAGRFFCSLSSRANGENTYGTAPRIDTWLLLEYPDTWMPHALEDNNLPAKVRDHLQQTALAVPRSRQLFIRQGHTRCDPICCFVVNSCESAPASIRVPLSSYAELAGADFESLAARPGASGLSKPLFLICTHGTHDKCCAKFGLPVYGAFRERAGEQAWQCSHVGGDRFAANVICFPHGLYYGHLCPDDVPGVIDSYARGEVYLKNYRGRCCYPRLVQVAEYFLRSESGITGVDDLRLIPGVESDGTNKRVRFESRGQIHEVEFRLRATQLEEYLTCKSAERKIVPQYELIRYASRAGADLSSPLD